MSDGEEKHPGDPVSSWNEDFGAFAFWACLALVIGAALWLACLLP